MVWNIVQDVTSERALHIVRYRVQERTKRIAWSIAGDDAKKEPYHVAGEKVLAEA
jgi:hypothetical protein